MKKGFTLIELLIVVAIIAILAAIAVPNFLEAQTRAKIARTKADMRSVTTALETYAIDNNGFYPPDGGNKAADIVWPPGPSGVRLQTFGQFRLNNTITTPIAYLTGTIYDPFVNKSANAYEQTYRYFEFRKGYMHYHPSAPLPQAYADYKRVAGDYQLISSGPDKKANTNTGIPGWLFNMVLPYDASNGTVSPGDIIRTQASGEGYVNVN